MGEEWCKINCFLICIYSYIYILYILCISIWKPFKYVMNKHRKIVLKRHFWVNISLSLQKLRQYNENLRKHQTKINTVINTSELKLRKNWNFKIFKSIYFIKKNKLKTVNQIIIVHIYIYIYIYIYRCIYRCIYITIIILKKVLITKTINNNNIDNNTIIYLIKKRIRFFSC